jgi:opacity protein-like surface antigen
MKKFIACAVIALACVNAAHAADESRGFYPLLGGGLTFGGEKLVTVDFTNGDSTDVRSGGLVQFYGGLEYRFNETFSVQGTIGYHVDNTSAENGSVRFSRYPLELIAHAHVADKFRLGAGVRFVNNPKLSGSGFASNVDTDFKDTTGFLVEGEYMFTPHVGFKVRGVSEQYKTKRTGEKADGDHIGLFGTYYF